MTKVEHSVVVNVPISTAYNQWTQFEDFPHFMNGIQRVTQLSDERLEWVAEIGGVRRRWEARILQQVPDTKVAWAATEGATNAGEVTFEDLGAEGTAVRLTLEYEPEGLVEKVGDKLDVVDRQTDKDLERFKALIESEGYASGAWRGTVQDVPGTPDVEDADASRGDSGKAGVSGKVAAAGVAAAAATAVGVAAAATAGRSSRTVEVGHVESGSGDRDATAGRDAEPIQAIPEPPTAPAVHGYDPANPTASQDSLDVQRADDGADDALAGDTVAGDGVDRSAEGLR